MNNLVQIITTAPSQSQARRIADVLLKQGLAACVQIAGPINSRYWWNGKIEKAIEWYCVIKSTRSQYKRIEKAIRNVHSYTVPEIICLPIIESNPDYTKWVQEETKKK